MGLTDLPLMRKAMSDSGSSRGMGKANVSTEALPAPEREMLR